MTTVDQNVTRALFHPITTKKNSTPFKSHQIINDIMDKIDLALFHPITTKKNSIPFKSHQIIYDIMDKIDLAFFDIPKITWHYYTFYEGHLLKFMT